MGETTRGALTAEEVAALSDVDLSELVCRALLVWGEWGRGLALTGAAHVVQKVLDAMRERWAKESPDLRTRRAWWIRDWGDYWCVAIATPPGAEFPEHFNGWPVVKREHLGRAVFECALLAATRA